MSNQGNMGDSGPIGIKIELNFGERRVVVEFNQPVEIMNFTPHQAIAFAEALTRKTMELADRTDVNLVLPPKVN